MGRGQCIVNIDAFEHGAMNKNAEIRCKEQRKIGRAANIMDFSYSSCTDGARTGQIFSYENFGETGNLNLLQRKRK